MRKILWKVKFYFWVAVAIVLLKLWESQFPVMRWLRQRMESLKEEYGRTV